MNKIKKFAGMATALALIGASGMSPSVASAQAVSFNQSGNWSGYVAGGGNYTAVAGSWSVPSVSVMNPGTQADATWVGIGGTGSGDLIQAGTEAIVQGGQITYQAWYELLPGDSVVIPLAVKAGDSISVSLTKISDGMWYLYFRNNTTGQSYVADLAYNSSGSSAEWIEEMPSSGSGLIPLDNFGTVEFSGAYAVENGVVNNLRSLNATAVTLTSGTTAMATPSALGADGESFSVQSTSTLVSPTPTTYILVPHVGRGYRRSGETESAAPSANTTGTTTTSIVTSTGVPVTVTYRVTPNQVFYIWRMVVRRAMQSGQQITYTFSFSR